MFLYPNLDGFVKSPSAALRGILRHCGVAISTPHSSGFARLATGTFYCAVPILNFYEIINLGAYISFIIGKDTGGLKYLLAFKGLKCYRFLDLELRNS
jgi:hypothetical protein